MKSSAIGVCTESGSMLMRTFSVEDANWAVELAQAISTAAQSRKSAPRSFSITFKASPVNSSMFLTPYIDLRWQRWFKQHVQHALVVVENQRTGSSSSLGCRFPFNHDEGRGRS